MTVTHADHIRTELHLCIVIQSLRRTQADAAALVYDLRQAPNTAPCTAATTQHVTLTAPPAANNF